MVINDRYIVGEVLGFGGFGTTYKAWDKSLNTVVAVKEYYYTGIVTRQPGTQNVMIYAQNRREEFHHFLNRFLDEARHTAKFSSNKNIVNVFEFFEANNTAYMVMEFLDGIPLNEFLKESTMDTEQAVKVMQSICAAVKAVHAAGIIHRDISPDNIFLCSNGIVKLIDFGAARFSKHESQQVSRLTQVMKPGFSPPEQYQSVSEQGPWTDIYAMGATLYFMITGIKPEESTNRKTEDKLAPPQELKPDLPGYINDTILRAMAVDTHLRFTTVDEFEKALIKEKKVLSVSKEKKRRWKKRLIGIVAASLVVGTGFSVLFYTMKKEKETETLQACTVEIWYAGQKGDSKGVAIQQVIDEFNKTYDTITYNVKAVEPSEYSQTVKKAINQNTLPQLFESTGFNGMDLKNTTVVSGALDRANNQNYGTFRFLKKYKEYFPEGNQLPLGFNAPVKYYIENKQENIENIAGTPRELFLAGFADNYTGTTADYQDVVKKLAGRVMTFKPITEKKVDCTFSEFWSMGKCDKEQKRAAEWTLACFLTNKAQFQLLNPSISRSLPLNEETLIWWSTKIYPEFGDTEFFKNADDYEIRIE